MAKMYVSYNQRDKAVAARVVDGLRSRGHTVHGTRLLVRS